MSNWWWIFKNVRPMRAHILTSGPILGLIWPMLGPLGPKFDPRGPKTWAKISNWILVQTYPVSFQESRTFWKPPFEKAAVLLLKSFKKSFLWKSFLLNSFLLKSLAVFYKSAISDLFNTIRQITYDDSRNKILTSRHLSMASRLFKSDEFAF